MWAGRDPRGLGLQVPRRIDARSVRNVIDPRSDRAVYRQLADLLRARIQSGELPPGALLPSEGRIQQEHGVGRETVRRALRVLRAEGLVVTRSGYGTAVSEPAEREPVRVPRGSTVISRPATADEQASLDIQAGGHVLVVTTGRQPSRVYAADRTELTFS